MLVSSGGCFVEGEGNWLIWPSQLIPSDIKWDPNATPPQYTDNGDQVIEKGTHLRIKLIGTRSDVNNMYAIGSVKEDFLGYVVLDA